MTINGLENNYYLSNNDIWISVNGFTEPTALLELEVSNVTSNLELPVFKLYPSPGNEYNFNICQIIRALFPDTNHINNNNLQEFEITFNVRFANTSTPDVSQIFTKYFVRGGRNKSADAEWFLSSSEPLVVEKWVDWGFGLPGFAQRIQNNSIVNFIPTEQFRNHLRGCDFKILKFLNSLGGYQYFVFETFEIKNKTKAGKAIDIPTNRLRKDNFKNTSSSSERVIEFHSKTPIEIQEVFTDLVNSQEVYLFHHSGTDNDSKWELLKLDNNESIENNYERVFENKISFEFSNYITR